MFVEECTFFQAHQSKAMVSRPHSSTNFSADEPARHTNAEPKHPMPPQNFFEKLLPVNKSF